jgi:hypothetical protein
MKWLPLVVVTALGSGCILIANDDPSKLGSTCEFEGGTTECGVCVATQCQTQLDSCCSKSTCASQLGYLDDCAGNADIDNGCQLLAATAPDLATCLDSMCGTACGVGDGGTLPETGGGDGTVNHTYCYTSGDECSCSEGIPPNGTTCDSTTVKQPALCCASQGWPTATDSSCSCQPFSCTIITSTYVECSLSSASTGTTTASSGTCCTDGTTCSCDSEISMCNSGNPVAVCDVTTIGCGASQTGLPSCSF